ncbi:MAG: ABC transporter substrate-binding protein, partial [Candidatus Entotheonellia bacterium]
MLPRRRIALPLMLAALTLAWTHGLDAQPKPAGELIWAYSITIPPAWFDPADAPAQIAPFGIFLALHDGLVRPMPGQRMGNSLAESWTESHDGLVYEFRLRQGLRFHNGDPCTAEDVKFSFERYRGSGAKELHAKVKRVESVDPLTVRFHLHEPWPDFMTFYGTTATAAGLVVPKKYLEKVGEDGFKKHPIGLGPYKFVSHTPGIELVLEAYEGYWRKVPHVKRLLIKGVPEAGYPNGLDAGELVPIPPFFDVAEAAVNDLNAGGIRVRMRAMERAPFLSAWREKRLRGLFLTAAGASGNAAT